MTRTKFIRKLRNFCRKSARSVSIDATMGRGSHVRVTVDGITTTVKSGELSPAYVALLLKQLGLPRDALD
jgi:hypothetical protein